MVKYQFFRRLYGGNRQEAQDLYYKHIWIRSGPRMVAGVVTDKWKKNLIDYGAASYALYDAMEKNGFDPAFPVPIDPNGELLDGSHRVACALALGIEEIPVLHRADYVWAPEWGLQWFVNNDFTKEEIETIVSLYEFLSE